MKVSGAFEARFGGLPVGEVVWKLAEALQAALDGHAEAVGPMVIADREKGEIELSFEFAAEGDPSVDVPRAMEILAEATGVPHTVGLVLTAEPVPWPSDVRRTPERVELDLVAAG